MPQGSYEMGMMMICSPIFFSMQYSGLDQMRIPVMVLFSLLVWRGAIITAIMERRLAADFSLIMHLRCGPFFIGATSPQVTPSIFTALHGEQLLQRSDARVEEFFGQLSTV